ncbi:hypothetical protein BWI93_12190 [Siphonobacter sp. BAB-5385]|nr:hypothetical protein BWI93_12190 [Siphonobacter sp. BAB-5385]
MSKQERAALATQEMTKRVPELLFLASLLGCSDPLKEHGKSTYALEVNERFLVLKDLVNDPAYWI